MMNPSSSRVMQQSLFASALLMMTPTPAGQSCTTELVSVGNPILAFTGGVCTSPAVTPDGRYVLFASTFTNLVLADNNNRRDMFVRDRVMGTTTMVSVNTPGGQSNGDSFGGGISADGRYVVFGSGATNLVFGDSNGRDDVFRHDCLTGLTEYVSLAPGGQQANGDSSGGLLSDDGRFVLFSSVASNLIANDTSSTSDLFLRDMVMGTNIRVNVHSNGTPGNVGNGGADMSADARYIVFQSAADNLVDQDTNGVADIFLHDVLTGLTTRVSHRHDGSEADRHVRSPSISADGRYVAFETEDDDMSPDDKNSHCDVFVRDLMTDTLVLVSDSMASKLPTNANSEDPRLSPDGRFVAFLSAATNLVPFDKNNQTDAFVRNLDTGEVERINLAFDGSASNGGTFPPLAVSTGAKVVAFETTADNLIATPDTNLVQDIYLRDCP